MVTAKTFTAQYDGREDRIILIVNYADAAERVDFMITRAMFLKLVPALEQILPEGAKAIYPQKREDQPQKQGLNKTDPSTMKLTRTAPPILLEKVDFKLQKKAETVMLLFYGELAEIPEAEATLSLKDLEQVIGVILGAIPFVEWGIASNILEH